MWMLVIGDRLACKLLTGSQRILDKFPNKKYYYVTIDDDTVLFPHRLMKLMRTIDSVVDSHTTPLYVGTVLNDHKAYVLCGGSGVDEVTNGVAYLKDGPFQPSVTPICCAQGGAGYIFNKRAMLAFANVTLCTADMDVEFTDGDQYVAFKVLYQKTRALIIHCGSFRPHGGFASEFMHHAVSFHHITDYWINSMNTTELKNVYHVTGEDEESD
jgi:hypothetical protein